MSFADNLMELRKLNNLSQEEIAEKIGVSMDDLISYEKNDSDNLRYAIPPKGKHIFGMVKVEMNSRV